MLNFIVNLLVSGLAVIFSSYILAGVHVGGFVDSIWVAFLLALVNSVIRPLLLILSLPVNILTLGLFTLVINALMILLVDSLVPSFSVDNFWWALLFSFVLSLISSLLNTVIPNSQVTSNS